MVRARFFIAVVATLVVFAGLVPVDAGAAAPPASGGRFASAAAAAARAARAAPAAPQKLNRRESTSSFAGVSCLSGSFCMAVGSFEAEDTEAPLAERWNGHAWSFTTVHLPVGSAYLNSVSCVSADFCMAVGAGSGGAVALMWDGSSWSPVDVASGYDNASFFGVSCPTASLCVAVGETTSGTAQALVEYWQGGSTFTLGAAANEAGVDLLTSVSCTTVFCMSVGWNEASGTPATPLTEVDFLGTWAVEPTPDTSTTRWNQLTGVSCTSFTSCLAVGHSSLQNQYRNISLTWDGTSWKNRSTPQPGSAADDLDAVSCVGPGLSDCTAAGDETSRNLQSDHTSIVHWNGSSWSVRGTPAAAPQEIFLGVSCSSASQCVAVGNESDGVQTLVLADSLSKGSWSADRVPDPVLLAQILAGVACANRSSCMAVGQYLSPETQLARRWNGHAWIGSDPAPEGALAQLTGTSCPTVRFCVAVGVTSPTSFEYFDVPANANVERIAYATTSQALIEVWNGTSWKPTVVGNSLGVDESLSDVSCVGTRFCMAVGVEDGFSPDSFVWRGQKWAEVALPANSYSDSMSAVSCVSPSSCIAVGSSADGDAGLAERWNGRSWSITHLAQPSMPYFALGGVSCVSSSRCTAVGSSFATFTTQSDLVESWNGKSWTVVPSPNPTGAYGGLAAVSCASAASCLAVGPSDDQESTFGVVLRWNGTAWTVVPLGTLVTGEVNLQGVDETSPGHAVVVGTKFGTFGFQQLRLVESGSTWKAT
jgi:hypothetical protein